MILFPLLIALAAAPPCPATADPASALCRALEASDSKKFAEAAAEFEHAAAASPPGDPRTQRLLAAAGNMWIAAGQPGKAAVALDRALAGTGLQADQRGLALLDRARAAEAQGDLKAARRFVSTATQSAADDPFLWYFSAALAIRENNPTGAKAAIDRALALAPTDPTILFEAGHVAHAGGNEAQARHYWSQADRYDPNGAVGKAAREALLLLTPQPADGAAGPPEKPAQ